MLGIVGGGGVPGTPIEVKAESTLNNVSEVKAAPWPSGDVQMRPASGGAWTVPVLYGPP